MFEYLMPFLFMPSADGSLLGVSAKSVIRAQIRAAARTGKPWGVSECAYHAFDHDLNYQYRAFGVSALAISDSSDGNVVSPYAACLALCAEPRRAAENLLALSGEGLRGEYGFYESKDYQNGDAGDVVFCYMSHHQGMALCALANALTGRRISEIFMSGARERALETLLNEKPFARPRLFGATEAKPAAPEALRAKNTLSDMARTVRGSSRHDGMILFGGDSTA